MLLIDTCFWMHLRELYTEIGFDLRPFFSRSLWAYTEAVRTEYLHYQIDQFISLETGIIFPVLESSLNQFRSKYPTITELDPADQTILLVAQREKAIVLTDDGDLLMESLGAHINAFRLPVFLLWLVNAGELAKRDCKRAFKFWESRGSYNKPELKRWDHELQKIQ